ncbi:MAG: hypothetical protein ABIR18_10960 [Chitinophagaceae bacterium]
MGLLSGWCNLFQRRRYFRQFQRVQPFVENAIWHGRRNKQEGFGFIKINFEQPKEDILISIEDNGVGREMAARYKSDQHVEYHSKGITLTQKRIEVLNAKHGEKVKTSIVELFDENGKPGGTKVILTFHYLSSKKTHCYDTSRYCG